MDSLGGKEEERECISSNLTKTLVYSLGGKEEEEWRCISPKSHENPVGLTRRKGRGGEGMYQLLISQEPLDGFARLTDKISALGLKEPLIKIISGRANISPSGIATCMSLHAICRFHRQHCSWNSDPNKFSFFLHFQNFCSDFR